MRPSREARCRRRGRAEQSEGCAGQQAGGPRCVGAKRRVRHLRFALPRVRALRPAHRPPWRPFALLCLDFAHSGPARSFSVGALRALLALRGAISNPLQRAFTARAALQSGATCISRSRRRVLLIFAIPRFRYVGRGPGSLELEPYRCIRVRGREGAQGLRVAGADLANLQPYDERRPPPGRVALERQVPEA